MPVLCSMASTLSFLDLKLFGEQNNPSRMFMFLYKNKQTIQHGTHGTVPKHGSTIPPSIHTAIRYTYRLSIAHLIRLGPNSNSAKKDSRGHENFKTGFFETFSRDVCWNLGISIHSNIVSRLVLGWP